MLGGVIKESRSFFFSNGYECILQSVLSLANALRSGKLLLFDLSFAYEQCLANVGVNNLSMPWRSENNILVAT